MNSAEKKVRKTISWKRNLVFIWIAQFFSIMGFSFGIPFAPFYFQSMGVRQGGELTMWVALFGASTPFAMAIFSPIWGALADRLGRRPMLLRAYIGGMFVLTLMGCVTGPLGLIVLRLIQGAFTGTVSAAQTLVAVYTPKHRSGIALGSLNSAVASGALTGVFLGGFMAEYCGFRMAFFLSGAVMLAAFLLVFFGVREDFERKPVQMNPKEIFKGLGADKAELHLAMPILFLIVFVMFVRQFDTSFVPLLVQDIHGKLEGISIITGTLFALCGGAGVLSGIVLGWIADRFSPFSVGKYSAFTAGLLMLPQAFTHSIGLLFCERSLMTFCAGGLDPVLQIWLCKMTPEKSRGLIFGLSSTARCVGWMFAPLCGGLIAGVTDVRVLFVVGALLYFGLIWLIVIVSKRIGRQQNPPSQEEIDKSLAVG